MEIRLPDPVKEYCPKCQQSRTFVPVYIKDEYSEAVGWKCITCGHLIGPNG